MAIIPPVNNNRILVHSPDSPSFGDSCIHASIHCTAATIRYHPPPRAFPGSSSPTVEYENPFPRRAVAAWYANRIA